MPSSIQNKVKYVSHQIMATNVKKRPKLVVFDLDSGGAQNAYCMLKPPVVNLSLAMLCYKLESIKIQTISKASCFSGAVIDSKGSTIEYYEEVPIVLSTLKRKGYTLAIASATPNGKGAEQLFELFDWNKYFTYKEMHPARKTEHFVSFRDQSGIQYEDMLFFDDELRNVYELRNVGVVSVLVRDGVNKKLVQSGLNDYARERSYK